MMAARTPLTPIVARETPKKPLISKTSLNTWKSDDDDDTPLLPP